MASRVAGTGAFANVSHRGSGFPVGHFSVPRSNMGDVVMAGLVARHGSGAGARDREREPRGSSRLRSTSAPAEPQEYRTPAGPQEELDWLDELEKVKARISTLKMFNDLMRKLWRGARTASSRAIRDARCCMHDLPAVSTTSVSSTLGWNNLRY